MRDVVSVALKVAAGIDLLVALALTFEAKHTDRPTLAFAALGLVVGAIGVLRLSQRLAGGVKREGPL